MGTWRWGTGERGVALVRAQEVFSDAVYVHNLEWGDGFKGVYICADIILRNLNTCSSLYVNCASIKLLENSNSQFISIYSARLDVK